MRPFPTWTVVGCVCLSGMGCRCVKGDARTTPSVGPAGSSSEVPQASASRATGSSSPPKIPYLFDLGCAGDVDTTRSLGDQLEAMGRICAPGMKRLAAWAEPVALLADRPRRLEVELPAYACIRIGMVSSSAAAVIRMKVVDSQNRAMVEAKSIHPPGLVPSNGPACTSEAGQHRVQLTSLGLDTEIRVGIWQAVAPVAPTSSK